MVPVEGSIIEKKLRTYSTDTAVAEIEEDNAKADEEAFGDLNDKKVQAEIVVRKLADGEKLNIVDKTLMLSSSGRLVFKLALLKRGHDPMKIADCLDVLYDLSKIGKAKDRIKAANAYISRMRELLSLEEARSKPDLGAGETPGIHVHGNCLVINQPVVNGKPCELQTVSAADFTDSVSQDSQVQDR